MSHVFITDIGIGLHGLEHLGPDDFWPYNYGCVFRLVILQKEKNL